MGDRLSLRANQNRDPVANEPPIPEPFSEPELVALAATVRIGTSPAMTPATAPPGTPAPGTTAAAPTGVGSVDGPLVRAPRNLDGMRMQAIVAGTLEHEAASNCVWLVPDRPADTRYPVVWGAEVRWQPDPPGIVGADGQLVVPVGGPFNGGGGYLKPDHVASLIGPAAMAALRPCLTGDGQSDVAYLG